MNLMALFRRYNKRIMAVVVIVLMIVFTIEPIMNYMSWRRSGGNKVVAYYGDKKKISSADLAWAQQQLEILNFLGAGIFLRPQDPRRVPTQDLQTVLLGELLFAERATGVETIGRLRQIVGNNNFGISDKQIDDIYIKAYPSQIYWLLLVREAHLAGVRVSGGAAKAQIQSIIPQLAEGATYERVVGAIVERQGVSEEQVIETFADLMTVIEYGRMTCSLQNRTMQQNLLNVVWQGETIDAEYVLFGSSIFARQARRPSEDKIIEQFEKYKGTLAGDGSEENPYGFGYKLPELVGLEYIAVRLDDVAATEPKPTQQEAEEYYQQHLSSFVYPVRSDPNDPNSPMKAQTRSYAEVALKISRDLYQQRVDSKAEQILLDAKSITEANLAGIDIEQSNLADEQIKERAVDYEKTSAQLSEKHKVRVYAGKTGLLSASDMQNDPQLGGLYLQSSGLTSIGLTRLVFAVEQLKASELGAFDVKPPRLYENIGPLKDVFELTGGYSGKNMALVRVIAAEKATEPKNVDEKLDRRTFRFDPNGQAGKDTNSIREMVVEDLMRLAAMDKTAEKANQFVQSAAKDGWDAAIDKFNEIYGNSAKKNDVNAKSDEDKPFRIQRRTGIRRIHKADLMAFESRYEGDPLGRQMLNDRRAEGMLVDKFCAILPDDANTLANAGAVVEFKPMMSYYCLKSLTVHQLYQEQFDRVKARAIIGEEFADAQVLAPVHYNPENILKRMNFILIKEQQKTTAPGAAEEPNAKPGDTGGN